MNAGKAKSESCINPIKPRIKQAVIVEGRYDRNTLSQVVDALIIETGGFNVFNNPETKAYIREVALKQGIVILTDSDSAGFMIRNSIKAFIPEEYIINAYIPDIQGKEKRKRTPGKEGKLGVEGMPRETLMEALIRAGVEFENTGSNATGRGRENERNSVDCGENSEKNPVTAYHLYLAGLSGRQDSKRRKAALLKVMNLPEHLSTKDLLKILNRNFSAEEFLDKYATEQTD